MKKIAIAVLAALPLVSLAVVPKEITLAAGESKTCGEDVRNFVLRGEAFAAAGAEATLAKNGIALEISARYRIPSARIVKMAKARGIKFTFGTNNATADFGRLEYALDMVQECGLTAGDVWFPSMSTRASRKPVAWNTFATTDL